jgi:hypothetical protein
LSKIAENFDHNIGPCSVLFQAANLNLVQISAVKNDSCRFFLKKMFHWKKLSRRSLATDFDKFSRASAAILVRHK